MDSRREEEDMLTSLQRIAEGRLGILHLSAEQAGSTASKPDYSRQVGERVDHLDPERRSWQL